MGSKTLSVSIPEEQFDFLQENQSLKPSAILQTGIENIQNSIKHNPQLLEANKTIALKQKQQERLQKIIQDFNTFLEDRDLMKEFNKEYPI